MKTIPVSVALDLKLTHAEIRAAAGSNLVAAVRATFFEERRMNLLDEARRSDIAAYSVAARNVSAALDRYEASVGTRDERRALSNMVAACTGLRKAVKSADKSLRVSTAPIEKEH
jgi:hypothetical protein